MEPGFIRAAGAWLVALAISGCSWEATSQVRAACALPSGETRVSTTLSAAQTDELLASGMTQTAEGMCVLSSVSAVSRSGPRLP